MSVAPPSASGSVPAGTPTLSPELQQQLARVTEISSLPEITTRIVEVVEDPKSTAQDMHDIVRNDPALASKILKVVNSAFYGLPSQIASLDRAIVMLGMSAVKNIALAASLSRMFRPGSISDRFAARDLWSHCIAVGVCSRLLAEISRGQVEEAFVAGLVHDLGLLIEYQVFPEKLAEVIDRVERTGESFCAVERELIGADHQLFGLTVATKWKFPPALRYAAAYHHNPENLRPEFRKFVQTVQLADTLCCQNQFGFYLTAQKQEVTDVQLAEIGTTPERVQELLEKLPEFIAETEQMFSD